ncbi:MAG: hypothetical protein JW812_03910 [Alphaproteobacteria bacterium]|nr:hypothetical protein [Alphaproteobacteria bacterium]MBN2780317.1 hypothetical protein [Alphaproteobacteria bacterium]
MEKDKQILSLSTLAIGVLILLRKSIENEIYFGVWISAGLAFLTSIIILLQMFSQNSDYIGELIKNNDINKKKELEKKLQQKTKWSFRFFITGVLLTFILASSSTGFYITILKG